MKQYISYSELRQFREDRDEYFKQYVLGIVDPPNKFMLLGSIIHKMLECRVTGEKYESWKDDILKAGWMPDKIRIAEKLVEAAPVMPEAEQKFFTRGKNYNLFGIVDGQDMQKKEIQDYKTSGRYWSQQEADESEQMTFYAYNFYLKNGWIPKIKIVCLNTSSGKVRVFETTRTREDFKILQDELDWFVKELKDLGWWEKRESTYKA